MQRIEARKTLRQFTIADYPYIRERRDKKKLHREVFKVGYPENFENRIVKTSELELV